MGYTNLVDVLIEWGEWEQSRRRDEMSLKRMGFPCNFGTLWSFIIPESTDCYRYDYHRHLSLVISLQHDKLRIVEANLAIPREFRKVEDILYVPR